MQIVLQHILISCELYACSVHTKQWQLLGIKGKRRVDLIQDVMGLRLVSSRDGIVKVQCLNQSLWLFLLLRMIWVDK